MNGRSGSRSSGSLPCLPVTSLPACLVRVRSVHLSLLRPMVPELLGRCQWARADRMNEWSVRGNKRRNGSMFCHLIATTDDLYPSLRRPSGFGGTLSVVSQPRSFRVNVLAASTRRGSGLLLGHMAPTTDRRSDAPRRKHRRARTRFQLTLRSAWCTGGCPM